jgi:hypothetical protein
MRRSFAHIAYEMGISRDEVLASPGYLRFRQDAANDTKRSDAGDTAFLNRQIEIVRSKVYEVKYAALLSREFLPTATDIPAYATIGIEVVYDAAGKARIISNGGEDLPRVDVIASELSFKVASLGAAYGYTLMDLRQAIGLGVPLTDRKALMARRVIDTGIDELLALGKLSTVGQDMGMTGFINAATPTLIVSGCTNLSWDDPATTALKILADMTALAAAPSKQTLQIYQATDLLLAPHEYNIVAAVVMPNTTETVLSFFLRTNPYIKRVSQWHRLTGAGAGGKNRAIAYAKDPEVIEAIVPQEFEQLPPQLKNLETTIPCHARCGGVRLHQPSAMVYMDLVVTTP